MTHSPADSRIVVGVDGSAASDAAVRWAVREARLRHASVYLVSAYHSDSGARAPYAPWSWLTRQDERYAAAEALVTAAAELVLRYLPRGRLMAELANEPPARALIDRTADAELLVLGTTRPARQSGQPPQAMGPVARTCLQLAHCPVVVVCPDDRPVRDLIAGPGEQDAAEPPGSQGQQGGIGREDAGLRQDLREGRAAAGGFAESVAAPRPGGDPRDTPHRRGEDFQRYRHRTSHPRLRITQPGVMERRHRRLHPRPARHVPRAWKRSGGSA
jgi:nucleotide-binding universal stress UspA family protein